MKADPSPFDLSPAAGTGRLGALCLHGLTGTPHEVRPVAALLAARGFRARAPALPGHVATPEVLRRTDHEEWLACAREELAKLRAEHERVAIVGVSMGGLVSLELCREGGADAAAVIGAPLRLRGDLFLRLLPLVMHVHRHTMKRGGSDIQDPAARERQPGYDRIPLRSVHELTKLQRRVRTALPRVSVPLLVAHGAHDRTADPRDAHRIAGAVSSDRRRLLVLPRSGHVVPVDYDGPRLAEAIAGFFEESLAS